MACSHRLLGLPRRCETRTPSSPYRTAMPEAFPPVRARRHALSGPASAICALCVGVAALLVAPVASAAGTTPAQQLQRFAAEAGRPGDAGAGQAFFATTHGGRWSCASCHRSPPLQAGRHASTGKAIDPLAPAAHPAAFTDAARVDKWFRRNCRDVLARECSAAEKADVLAYLMSLKP